MKPVSDVQQVITPTQSVPCIGIDLGTTHSLIAVWNNGQATLLPNALGSFLTPSVVSVSDEGELLVGQAAKERLMTHPNRTASVFKRHMGTSKLYKLEGETHAFTAEDLSALVLQSLRDDAEYALGCSISDVVISVPAYFNDTQRKATRNAAHIAGLNVVRLINEPTAAALSYGLHKAGNDNQFMVVDLGGGTLDVSVVELFENMIEVKSSTGDNQLGGEDFTQVLSVLLKEQMRKQSVDTTAQNSTAHILLNKQFTQQSTQQSTLHYTQNNQQGKISIKSNQASLDKQIAVFLYHQAERCKLILSQHSEANWDAVFNDSHYTFNVTQALFVECAASLLIRFCKAVERAMRDAHTTPAQLQDIVLVGGASRMPIIRQALHRLLGKHLNTQVQPDEAIALGAAILAGLCAQDSSLDEIMMTDVCPYSLGIDTVNMNDIRGTDGNLFSCIIARNTLVPVSMCENYLPTEDYQTEVTLNIYQGESRLVRDNIQLGKLTIPLPRRKKDNLSIDVRFSYDVSGLLEVDAVVLPTGAKYSLSLLGQASSLSRDEINECKAQLSRLRVSPRDQQENRSLIARLERLHQEYLGDICDEIQLEYSAFTQLLNTKNLADIARERLRLNMWCDNIEADSIIETLDTDQTVQNNIQEIRP
jgi:molecular chaperone HscC